MTAAPELDSALMQPIVLCTSDVNVHTSKNATGTYSMKPLRPVHLQNTASVIIVMPPSSWLDAPNKGQMFR